MSLHVTAWPVASPAWEESTSLGDQLAVLVDATRALRSAARLGAGTRLSAVVVQAHSDEAAALLDQLAEPLRIAARADAVIFDDAQHPSGLDGITIDIRHIAA